MSSYATTDDLVTYGLSSQAVAYIPLITQQNALDAASTLADGYLGDAFELPVVTPSADLVEAVCKIAAYSLLSMRGYNPENGADQNIRDRYRDAIHWLEQIAAGRVLPNLTDSTPAGTREGHGGPFVIQPQRGSNGEFVNGTPRRRGW